MINRKKLSVRIKKNEGYSDTIYLDRLNNKTIGYGHLIKKEDRLIEKKKYKKFFLNSLFENDLSLAIKDYKKHFSKYSFSQNISEVLVEMIFQLGIQNVLKFKKMIKALRKEDYQLAVYEMENSKWNKQTPFRVKTLSKYLLKLDEKQRHI